MQIPRRSPTKSTVCGAISSGTLLLQDGFRYQLAFEEEPVRVGTWELEDWHLRLSGDSHKWRVIERKGELQVVRDWDADIPGKGRRFLRQ